MITASSNICSASVVFFAVASFVMFSTTQLVASAETQRGDELIDTTVELGAVGGGEADAAAGGGVVSPSDGDLLNVRHVLFEFPAADAYSSYQLQVAVNGGGPDLFKGDLVADLAISRNRRILTQGFEFGGSYAWRYRAIAAGGEVGAWSATHLFSIDDIPQFLTDVVQLNVADPARMQPGITLTSMGWVPGADGFYSVAFNEMGEYVWFLRIGNCDVRMLRNGNILGASTALREVTLQGDSVWVLSQSGINHREASDMPNGNVMYLRTVEQDVVRDGELQRWYGQRIVEIDRQGDVVWSWNPFDHLSTLDFDECIMETPDGNGLYDWTHANAAHYDAVENVVYYSSRHLSRIVKIDYATGEVIWNFGLEMPSGDVDFGDDLFSFQHAPEVQPNGNLLLYDNGNRRGHSFCTSPNPYSSAVEFKIDPDADPPVVEVWRFEHAYSSFVGDADRLPNGNTLVDAGGRGLVMEVTPDGEVVWELCAAPGATFLYRADRIPTLYPLAADTDGDDDVDLHDFGRMQRCFGGTDMTAIHHWCLINDLDDDGDVDLDDFKLFERAFTGIVD
jgi:Arylsulfotransferase (ASST)